MVKKASSLCPIFGDKDGARFDRPIIFNQRVTTKSLAGANIELGATYTDGQLWEMRTKVTSWSGIGTSFSGYYWRTEVGVASGSCGIKTHEIYCMVNGTYSVSQAQGVYIEAGAKAGGTQTIANMSALECSLAPYTGTGAITITNHWECLYLTPSACSSRLDSTNAAKIHGIYLLARDGDGASTKLGDGFYMGNDSGQSGTRTLTNGINMAIAATTGILLAGATTTGISITGSATDGIKTVTGTFTDAIELAGTITNGVNISGTCSGTGLIVAGAALGASFVVNNGTITTEAYGISMTHTGTLSSADNMIGLNIVTTTGGTAGQWASALYAKIVQGTTKNVNGYINAAELELAVGAGTYNPADMFVLTLNATITNPNISNCSHHAFIALRDYSTTTNTWFKNFLWLGDQTIADGGTTLGNALIQDVNAAKTHSHSLRILVGTTPLWIMCHSTAPD